MNKFELGVVTHIVSHLPKREVNLMKIAKEIPIEKKEAEKIIKTERKKEKSKTSERTKLKIKIKEIFN